MAIDRAHVGYALPAFTVAVTPERIAKFRAAIGETGGDVRVAPPTFMKMVEGEHNSSRRILDTLAVDLRRVLHAEQQFDYVGPILAGDQLDVVRSVSDIYERKNGLMEFIVIESTISHAERGLLGRSRQVVLVRNPKPAVAA
ncbi:MaoC family dehydratase N-terminal domain-containing protein [Nevskia sp.]|uniref:FAS1-like dehydratase domain-containing protein n=1 Tax=Nevskia sp. TaxID=1929292 RepID=UPI0025DC9D85|nr:MaoC family dehydratase N-terminal domain-containing protein [Nevskia sp.]